MKPEPVSLKHYKDGEFHKDYDRKESVQSFVAFMKDPTGEAPWEEDTSAKDVIHINSEKVGMNFIFRGNSIIYIMLKG